MVDKFGKLLQETLQLDENSRLVILEAWNNKLVEVRKEIASELREEFARKFTHDKDLIVESMDKFLTEQLNKEMAELAVDRKALRRQEVQYKTKIAEHMDTLNKFIVENLSKEVRLQKQEQNNIKNGFVTLENFVLKQLSEEITEFQEDKKSLREQKVKLIRDGKKQLQEIKKAFISKSSQLVYETINTALRSEITQLKEDIHRAKQNDFGRRIFESFSAEYLTSFLNENTEMLNLKETVQELNQKLKSYENISEEQKSLNESLKNKLVAAKDMIKRERILNKLLAPLGKEPRETMESLLETVHTQDLEKKYTQYLPTVLNEVGGNSQREIFTKSKNRLVENTLRSEKTGDRVSNVGGAAQHDYNISDINYMKKLAGIK